METLPAKKEDKMWKEGRGVSRWKVNILKN